MAPRLQSPPIRPQLIENHENPSQYERPNKNDRTYREQLEQQCSRAERPQGPRAPGHLGIPFSPLAQILASPAYLVTGQWCTSCMGRINGRPIDDGPLSFPTVRSWPDNVTPGWSQQLGLELETHIAFVEG